MNGQNGLPGRDGRDGAKGEMGVAGSPGPHGVKGDTGQNGTDADVRNWKQCAWRSEDSRDIGLIKVILIYLIALRQRDLLLLFKNTLMTGAHYPECATSILRL